MASKYNIKYFYDIQDRSDFKANPDYKGGLACCLWLAACLLAAGWCCCQLDAGAGAAS
jgi:hypothetical protein